MKFFPSLLLALAPTIICLFSEAKVPAQTPTTKQECEASKKELQIVTKKLERLIKLKDENESLFEKYKSDFKAKIKVSSNLLIIHLRSKTLTMRKKSLKEKQNQINCKGPTS